MAFDQLIDIFTLMFEIAPLILILMLFMTVMTMFENRMGAITILIGAMILSSAFFLSPISNVEAENLQDFYSDSRGFNLLDICQLYPMVNITDGRDMSNRTFTNGSYDIIESYETVGVGNIIKPHKTISFNSGYTQDSIILISKMVYNWTAHDEFRINVYYEDFGNTSITLYAFFNDYITEATDGNVTNDYKYINGGLKHYQSTTQTVAQRSSNIVNTYDHDNVYNVWEREYGGSNTLTSMEVRNVTVSVPYSIKTNQWITLSFKKDSFIWGSNIFNSENFINIGLRKNHVNHTLIVNDIQVQNRITKNKNYRYPFKEYYEFKEITDNTTDRLFWHLDMVEVGYQNLETHSLEFGIYSGKLRLYYDGVSQWNSTELYLDNDPDSLYHHFTGYQFNLQLDDDGHYSIYLFYKWNFNQREAGSQVVTYNYTFQDFVINAETYAYLHNFEYYGNTNETDIQISFTQYSHKWDILDTEIRKIDVDLEQNVILVHDVDSGGFKVPSISDLKKAFTDKIVKPVTSSLTTMKNELLKPINSITTTVSSFSSSFTTVIAKVTDTVNAINSGFSSMTTTVTSSISGLQTALETAISGVTSAVNLVKDSVDLVKSAVDTVEVAIQDSITAIGIVKDTIQELVDTFGIGGDIWTFIDAIDTALNSIFNGFSWILQALVDFLPVAGATIIDFLVDIGNWLVEVAIFLGVFLDISFTIFGTVFLYRIILGLNNYNESGDINALYSILETLMTVAEYVFVIFRVVIQFIGGILP